MTTPLLSRLSRLVWHVSIREGYTIHRQASRYYVADSFGGAWGSFRSVKAAVQAIVTL